MNTTISKYETHAQVSSYGRGVRIWFHRTGMVGRLEIEQLIAPVSPVVVNNEDMGVHEPTLELDDVTAKNLMDALWSAGLRPRNGEGMDAQVTAIKAHLEDMRTLVFKNKPSP